MSNEEHVTQDDLAVLDTSEEELAQFERDVLGDISQCPGAIHKSIHTEVWNTLSRIDVGDHIEVADIKSKTGASYKYSYLSWSWAWATLMKHYPQSSFAVMAEEKFDDGTVNVNIELTVRDGDAHVFRQAWLPVMDRRNNAIVNPNARDINDARMRCLVKAMAFCGLGLDIWTGSDMPVGSTEDPLSPDQVDVINDLIEKAVPDMPRFLKWLQIETVEEIPRSKFKQAVNELERKIKASAREAVV